MKQIRRIPPPITTLVAVLQLLVVAPVAATPASDEGITELIVRLAPYPTGPRPEDVVDAALRGAPLPAGLDVGSPNGVKLAIRERPTGRTLDWILENPDTPLARLQRYIVIQYDPGADLDANMALLAANSDVVESVEKNLNFSLSLSPSDPMIGSQWGIDALNLRSAWDYTVGHAFLGFIDTGLEVEHPELRAFHRDEQDELVYDQGGVRAHLGYDYLFNNCGIDELDPEDGVIRTSAGHGTVVAGIAAARTDDKYGVAAACWKCSILMIKSFKAETAQGALNSAANALLRLVHQGTQIVSMSFGISDLACGASSPGTDPDIFCKTLALADRRDVLLMASSGNDKLAVEFPASDNRVMAIGGIESDGKIWDWADDPENCPCKRDPLPEWCTIYSEELQETVECGSNYGSEIELVGPGKNVLSTVYTGRNHSTDLYCGDTVLGDTTIDGHGVCTGTSMASPYVAGIGGLLRSCNPLLPQQAIRDALNTTASQATSEDDEMGYGTPHAAEAVKRALGRAGGEVLANRLTPLFCLYSPLAETHVCTTVPSAATGFILDFNEPFDTVGPLVHGYEEFPDLPCVMSPCDEWAKPRAEAYLFTTEKTPYPEAPPLVPLYRLRYDPNIPRQCAEPGATRVHNRDFTYTTEELGLLYFKELTDDDGVGYELDGIEGYIFERCEPEPECIPEGAVRLFRLYHPTRNDFAIFPDYPEGREEEMRLAGYESVAILRDWIGYVYPNVDSDGDFLIDGFERLIGTLPDLPDTDCDGLSDGEEILFYDMSSPEPSEHGYGDPLDGPCLFSDGFESGDTSRWTEALVAR